MRILYQKIKSILFICIILIIAILSALSGYYFRENTASIKVDTIEKANATSTPETLSSAVPELKAFYGIVIDKGDRDTLLLQQILISGDYGATMYLVHTNKDTNFDYISSNEIKNAKGRILSKGITGSYKSIKKNMYAFVVTKNFLVGTPLIYAESISYSEVSPFPLNLQ